MFLRVATALTALALFASAGAQAAIYTGKASNGPRVKLRTNAKGKPNRVVFGNYKARCSRGYDPVKTPITGFIPPFDAVSTERVLDRGSDRGPRGEVRVEARWYFEARHTDEDRWRGRFHTKGVFLDEGKPYTRCSVGFRFELKRR